MSVTLYKSIHLMGALMVFLSMGGLFSRGFYEEREGSGARTLRKVGGITNGVGLVLLLASGFGMVAQLGIGFPGWVLAKMTVWVALGSLILLASRKPDLGRGLWWVALVLGILAVYLVEYKPF